MHNQSSWSTPGTIRDSSWNLFIRLIKEKNKWQGKEVLQLRDLIEKPQQLRRPWGALNYSKLLLNPNEIIKIISLKQLTSRPDIIFASMISAIAENAYVLFQPQNSGVQEDISNYKPKNNSVINEWYYHRQWLLTWIGG